MGIVKHSKRTLRRGCEACGSKAVYLAHDTSVPGDYCPECEETHGTAVSGPLILIDTDGTPHIMTCPGVEPGAVTTETPEEALVTAPAPVSTPAPEPTTGGLTPEALGALQTLLSTLAPSVSREDVAALVRTEVAGIVYPTRTVVERLDGTVKPIEGATHNRTADVLMDLQAGEHVMLVGPAGTGKSTIAEQCAEALGVPFYALSLSPQTPTSALLGYQTATGETVRPAFREAYEHGGVFCLDEIDNGHPSTLAVLNAGLANSLMAFPDGMVKRHSDFKVVATANTYGKGADRAYVGRQQIDAATLDRFTVETIEIDEALETDLCMGTGLEVDQVKRVLKTVRQYRANAEAKRMLVVISPRATVGMCRLLGAGKSWESAIESRVRKGMSDADWQKLTTA